MLVAERNGLTGGQGDDRVALMDGKNLSERALDELAQQIKEANLDIGLAIILVGDDAASQVYVRNKERACAKVGVRVEAASVEEAEVAALIRRLNADAGVTGIILQSPVPAGLDFDALCELIDPKKDVDGFTSKNIYSLYRGEEQILPCTVRGILRMLEEYEVELEGANVTVVGRGKIVGRPLGLALANRGATVTSCQLETRGLGEITQRADIVVMAAGSPRLLKASMVKPGVVVFDVGTSLVGGKLVGDVDFAEVAQRAALITPNPGGVGPMTVAMIIANLVDLART